MQIWLDAGLCVCVLCVCVGGGGGGGRIDGLKEDIQ